MKRIVISGIGVISPIGIGKEEYWDSLIIGRSGISRITLFDPSPFPTQIAGEVKNFDPSLFLDGKNVNHYSRSSQFAIGAVKQALEDAGLLECLTPEDIGLFIGVSTNSMEIVEEQIEIAREKGLYRMDPFAIATSIPNSVVSDVASFFGFKGPLMTVSTGCVAGIDAIAYGCEAIRKGEVRIVICGGVDCPLSYYTFMGFCAARIMSTRNDIPDKASRPFDALRDGGILSEACGILVLEELEDAEERGARIYGEVMGYGNTGEGESIVTKNRDEEGMVKAITKALHDASITPENVDYISAHAPSDPILDILETRAIKKVFGERAYQIPVSSIKSMIGSPLAAAGPLQVISALMSLTRNVIPPTINYEKPDPECDLDCVPNQARESLTQIAMVNSHAFGGNDSVLILGKV